MTENKIISDVLKFEPVLLQNDRVSVSINPKGAFINSLDIDGNSIIFPRENDNPKRGGIPVLGPTPGPVSGTVWESLYPKMPQHGQDRQVIWDIENLTKTKVAFERLVGPREFLFNGRLIVNIELLKSGLMISKLVTNFEDKPREIGSAFHPYFTFDKKAKIEPNEIARFFPLTVGKAEKIKPGLSLVTLINNNGSYKIEAEPQPVVTLVWTDKPNNYVCVEPWWAEVGKGDVVEPRETKKYTLVITKS